MQVDARCYSPSNTAIFASSKCSQQRCCLYHSDKHHILKMTVAAVSVSASGMDSRYHIGKMTTAHVSVSASDADRIRTSSPAINLPVHSTPLYRNIAEVILDVQDYKCWHKEILNAIEMLPLLIPWKTEPRHVLRN